MKRSRSRAYVAAAALTLACGCSTFTSIKLEENGKYAITGVQAPGATGFVWVCTYDPATRTLTVEESK